MVAAHQQVAVVAPELQRERFPQLGGFGGVGEARRDDHEVAVGSNGSNGLGAGKFALRDEALHIVDGRGRGARVDRVERCAAMAGSDVDARSVGMDAQDAQPAARAPAVVGYVRVAVRGDCDRNRPEKAGVLEGQIRDRAVRRDERDPESAVVGDFDVSVRSGRQAARVARFQRGDDPVRRDAADGLYVELEHDEVAGAVERERLRIESRVDRRTAVPRVRGRAVPGERADRAVRRDAAHALVSDVGDVERAVGPKGQPGRLIQLRSRRGAAVTGISRIAVAGVGADGAVWGEAQHGVRAVIGDVEIALVIERKTARLLDACYGSDHAVGDRDDPARAHVGYVERPVGADRKRRRLHQGGGSAGSAGCRRRRRGRDRPRVVLRS